MSHCTEIYLLPDTWDLLDFRVTARQFPKPLPSCLMLLATSYYSHAYDQR